MHPPLIFITINTQQILSNHLCPCITPMSELLKTMNWLHCPNFFADKLKVLSKSLTYVILLRYNVKLPSLSHTVKPSLSKPFERFWTKQKDKLVQNVYNVVFTIVTNIWYKSTQGYWIWFTQK